MGLAIEKSHFTREDEQRFEQRLQKNLQALESLFSRPGFGEGPITLGAELEVYIIDQQGRPLSINKAIQQDVNDPQLTLELNRYNLEYNLSPIAAAGCPFSTINEDINNILHRLNQSAKRFEGRIVPIGILPTLTKDDFGPGLMTQTPRYEALVSQLKKRRNGSFHIDIDGEPRLQLKVADVTMEGANTSMQIHLRVPPEKFADLYNAVQLATPLVVGLAANSPYFLGHKLWQETRIPLFKQSIDSRTQNSDWLHPARVQFGHGWVRDSALELFRETVSLYPPLLPICSDQDAVADLAAGKMPSLDELRLHQSTVWLWNRPVFDPADGGHLRIEMRALPAGPSSMDMAANTALIIGLATAMAEQVDTLLPALPFHYAEYNFYRAAQFGMDAKLVWPDSQHSGVTERPLTELVDEWLPASQHALTQYAIDERDIEQYFNVITARLENRQNGAQWQMSMIDNLTKAGCEPKQLAQHMLNRYLKEQDNGRPVAEWSLQP